MGSNVRSFNLAVGKHTEEVPKRVEQLHRRAANEALRGVVQMSPVDTGRFMGNWQQTTDTPASGTLDARDPTGNETVAKGEAVIAKIRPYSISWLVNNLDYAISLERGHSTQAPLGVLAVTATRLRAWLARQR